MRIAYKNIVADEIIYDLIEIDKNVSFNFTKNSIKFWTKYDDSSGTICREYIVEDLEKLYNQMLKDGYIDLTMYKPFNEFQQVSTQMTYHLIKKGKVAQKVLDWEDEDEDGIDHHIEMLKKQIKEWENIKEELNNLNGADAK